MIEHRLIENVLSALFEYLNKKVLVSPTDMGKFDFIIKGENNDKIAIEIKRQNISLEILNRIEKTLRDFSDISEFYLITPEEPSSDRNSIFRMVFRNHKIKTHWVGINKFIAKQNLGIKLTDDMRNALSNLQVAAVTAKYADYSQQNIGNQLGQKRHLVELKRNMEDIKDGKIDRSSIFYGLTRQFPYKIISEIEQSSVNLSETLFFGKKYEDAIIVLTDIKNFSSIVSVSDPDELNDLMSKYYTSARELVFRYGGILDKFIGDAVLAIFNYPLISPSSQSDVIKFCAELILLGKNILGEFQKKLDQEIISGTRVGIAAGPIYALDIGKEGIEVTFLSDKINLAARLENKCLVNGILLSNRFFQKLDETDHIFMEKIVKNEVIIPAKDARGQLGNIKAWQIDEDQMEKLLN